MPVPFPGPDDLDLEPPDAAETARSAAGVLSAARPPDGNSEFQQLLITAAFEAMTGHAVAAASLPVVDASIYAEQLRRRAPMYRMRMVHMMVLAALVLRPIPPEVAASVADFSRELGIDDGLLRTVEQFATTHAAMAAADFERNGYTAGWSAERSDALHTELTGAWDIVEHDAALAARWHALASLPRETLGHGLHWFYRARGFAAPGDPGSAPPLLAQHDWVHVLADYGTTVEAELEVFALIARANDDPRGFSLLAMVVSLFETGYLEHDAGLFDAFPDQLSHAGMTVRIGDALRRGALSHGPDGEPDVDFMQVDWFRFADQPLGEVRKRFAVGPKSANALAAGSASPWGPGGISPTQLANGMRLSDTAAVPYDSFGATAVG